MSLLSFTTRGQLPVIQQAEAAECGLACLAMVASYHGHRIDLNTLRRRYPASLNGVTLRALIQVAIGLAAVGVYGVMALAVAERTAEVGVRVALGASAADILGLVLGQAARLSLIGVVTGLAAALAIAPLLASQLFGVVPFDPLTFAAVPALLMLIAIAATLGPARRAMRVDPTKMLRGEP